MVAPDDDYEPRDVSLAVPSDAPSTASEKQREAPTGQASLEPEKWRAALGRHVVNVQQAMDSNLMLVRVGCILVMAGSAYAAVNLSGVLSRFNHVNDIPSQYFRQRKAIRVRMVRQSETDPNVFYVYHTPFLRRALLRDTLPPLTLSTSGPTKPEPLIAVRAFGIQVDEAAQEWIWSNVVSSHRYMTIRPMHRMNAEFEGQESLATCAISIRKWPFDRDFAHELVSNGLAESLPEHVDKYADNEDTAKQLLHRLKQLEAAQKHAQTMQYGIWKDWQDEKLSNRVLSASKRLSNRGFQKLVNKVTGSE